MTLCELQTGRLDRMVGYGGIWVQRQETRGNKQDTI